MGKVENYMIFVYSELQINEENEILNPNNKRFVCGKIFIGNTTKKFTKMVKESDFDGYVARYPDTRIVAKGDRTRYKFSRPTTESIVEENQQ